MQRQPYLNGTCQFLDSNPDSSVCFSREGNLLVRLSIASENTGQASQLLKLRSTSDGAESLISQIGETWAAPLAVNQSYRLDWAEPLVGSLYFEVFPLEQNASVTLRIGVSNATGQIQVETANQSLQLGQQLPSSPRASAAAYDVSSGTLSLLLLGASSTQTQVCT